MQTTAKNSVVFDVSDAQVREQALDVGQSFIVQAPAGSGKTGLLTHRFLALLSVAEVGPEECLAITFTRKAAAEMRDRILMALERAKNATPPEDPFEQKTWRLARKALDRDLTLGWDLCHNPNRLKIQTIDALCAGLTRQMPILSGFGATPQIIEDPSELYLKAAQNLLKALETDDHWSRACRILLAHLDNHLGLAVRLLKDMLSHRDQWLPYIGKTLGMAEKPMRALLESGLKTVTEEALETLVSHIPDEPTVEELLVLAEQQNWPGSDIEDVPAWQCLATLIFTQENTLRKTVTQQQGFPAPSSAKNAIDKEYFKSRKDRMQSCLESLQNHPLFLEKLRLLRECPPITYTADQWQVLWALMQLLPVLAAELALVFQENNTVDFTEMSLAALKALGDSDAPTDLALGLDYKIRHLLVDEFQDTSLSQFRLLEKLTAGWQPHDGRTLFLVGDPMQSIYRFRQAEVGLFIRAKQQGINDIVLNALTLTTNFRSEFELVKWTNTYFKERFPTEDNIVSSAIAFTASTAFKGTKERQDITASVLPVTAESEAAVVVDLINAVKEAEPQSSIALIVRSRRHLESLLPSFREANIAFEGIQLERLSEHALVQDLLTLTRALLHFGDRIAWLALLRTPWVSLSLEDLFLIANHESVLPIWHTLQSYTDISGLSEVAKQKLAIVVPCLFQAFQQYQRLPIRTWVFQTWVALEVDANQQDAEAYFILLEQLEAEGDVDVVGVLEAKIHAHYATATKSKVDDNKVQIMTIHKAKGLEFDTVIVPGVGKRTMGDPSRLLLWEERIGLVAGSYFLMAPIKKVGDKQDPIYTYLRQQEAERSDYEAIRLAYVAATRAKKRLYWLTLQESNKNKQVK